MEHKDYDDKDLTVFQVQLKKLFQPEEQKVINDLIRLFLLKKSEKVAQNLFLTELYDFLGMDKFIEFLSLFEEKSLKIPSLDDFQEAAQTCLCLYLKNYQNKSWKEIEDFIALEGTKPKKLGRKIQSFQNFIDYTHEKTVSSCTQNIELLKKRVEEAENELKKFDTN